jgi:hypothetical protein
MRSVRLLVLSGVALISLLASPLTAGAGSDKDAGSYVCTGGNIPTGTYSSVRVTGICYVPTGLVKVKGNLTVAPGALLDATSPAGLFVGSPANLPGIVQVGGNIRVQKGAVLFLGCDFAIVCPLGSSTYPGILFPDHPELGSSNPGDVVEGNIVGDQALGIVVHSVKIEENASVIGGGGGPAQLTGGPGSGACFNPALIPAPWNEDPLLTTGFPTPVYSDFEETSIGGNLKLMGLQTCWMGSLRNKIHGNVLDQNNTFGDPDGNEVIANFVSGNMVCRNNNSVVQVGDSAQPSNVVSGNAVGECGFNVIDPTGIPISVKAPEEQS